MNAITLDILYLGAAYGTSLDRAKALQRLGHRVRHIDIRDCLPATKWIDRITWRLGGQWFSSWVISALCKQLRGSSFDLCYVDSGEWVTPQVIGSLRRHSDTVINYNVDDPLGPRDGARFRAYRLSVPFYDLCVVMRPENVVEANLLGARHVIKMFRAADEVAHAPRTLTARDRQDWAADVLFLGTWFPERGPFLSQLVALGVPLTIRGPNWDKAPEWPLLKKYWSGGTISGDDYAKAIQCAKVNIGLVSKGNRDLHTQRSLEVPALGGLLCAERTEEHLELYVEGREALFWSDAAECASACRFALENEEARAAIAKAGHARVAANGNYNESILRIMLDVALERRKLSPEVSHGG